MNHTRHWIAPATLATLMLLAGCQSAPPAPDVARRHDVTGAASPHLARVIVDFKPHSQWNDARRAKVTEAARLMEKVLNQPEFAQAFGRRDDLQRAEGYRAPDIVLLLRAGATLADTKQNLTGVIGPRAITLALAISPAEGEFSRDAGFTDLDTLIIYLRRDWLDTQPLCAVAGLLAHEHMHVMGFNHASFNHPWLRRSVPYVVGDMLADHAQKGCLLKDEKR